MKRLHPMWSLPARKEEIMHRYDTDTERGWERGRFGRREFENRRFENRPEYDLSEGWRGYEGRPDYRSDERDYRRFDRGYESRGYENQGYGDQGSWGQPYSDEFRSQDWSRQFGGRESYGGLGSREGFGREYGPHEFRGGLSLHSGEQRGQYFNQQNRGRFSGKGPRGYQRSDQRIQEEINDRLTEHPEIDASEIEVKVNNGEATLTGSVMERYQKRLAEDLVENIGGVKQVHNQVRVQQELGAGSQQQQQQRKTASSESQQQQHELTGTAGSRR
jgi:osmotically-inducible protein OsmY